MLSLSWASVVLVALALRAHAQEPTAPGKELRDCPACPQMVIIPAGTFLMGSPIGEAGRSRDEGPQHPVVILRPFAVGKFEVTFAEWDACAAESRCKHRPNDQGWGRGKQPVINVSWDDAKEYARWLSGKTGKPYRLLTEAEWEYAARGGIPTTPFSTGLTITTDQANFDGAQTYGGSAKGQYRQRAVEVGTFKPNAFGLHDPHGNVSEWVEDCYQDSYVGAPTDGSARSIANCAYRIFRGGSWHASPRDIRSASRMSNFPDYRDDQIGFRVARSL